MGARVQDVGPKVRTLAMSVQEPSGSRSQVGPNFEAKLLLVSNGFFRGC